MCQPHRIVRAVPGWAAPEAFRLNGPASNPARIVMLAADASHDVCRQGATAMTSRTDQCNALRHVLLLLLQRHDDSNHAVRLESHSSRRLWPHFCAARIFLPLSNKMTC